MRRSGTSLTANILRGMGFVFHNDARSADNFNEEGYWESRRSEILNTKLLSYLGGDQDKPGGTPKGWENDKKLQKLSHECESFVSELQSHELWGWKDTRLCITLPFWKRYLGKDVNYLVCVRNPLEVARSWHKMDRNIDIATATSLWFTFTANALKSTFGESTLLIFHEDYFSQPEAQISKIASFIGRKYDPAVLSVAAHNLRHQESSPNELLMHPDVSDSVKLLYSSLLLSKSDKPILRSLQEQFKDYSKGFSSWNRRVVHRLKYYASFGDGRILTRILKGIVT